MVKCQTGYIRKPQGGKITVTVPPMNPGNIPQKRYKLSIFLFPDTLVKNRNNKKNEVAVTYTKKQEKSITKKVSLKK